MTTTSSPHARHAPAPQWARALQMQLRMQLQLAGWFWAIILGGAALVISTQAIAGVDVMVSVAQFAHHGGLWFPFSLSIILTTAMLPMHVASGMTWRSFILSALVSSAAVALLYASGMTLLLVLERWLYQPLGWVHGLASEEGGQMLGTGVLGHFSGVFPLYLAGTLSGLLVGITYYRTGGLRGTVLLPLTVAPIVLVGLFGLDPATQWAPWGLSLLHLGPARYLLLPVVLVAAAVSVHLLSRRIPITSSPHGL